MASESAEGPLRYLGVMISSTFRDLREHRAAVISAVEGQGLHAVGMEQDAALPGGTVVDSPLRKVGEAAAYTGVVSRRYGQVPECAANPDRLSLSELEFREARRLDRPMLIFIMAEDHPLTEADVEFDADKRVKLVAFREQVKRASAEVPVPRVYKEFRDVAEFSVAAAQSVAALHIAGIHPPAMLTPVGTLVLFVRTDPGPGRMLVSASLRTISSWVAVPPSEHQTGRVGTGAYRWLHGGTPEDVSWELPDLAVAYAAITPAEQCTAGDSPPGLHPRYIQWPSAAAHASIRC